MPEKYVNAIQAGAMLGLHPQSVRQMVKRGQLPAFRRQGEKGFFIKESDVLKLKERRSALVPVVPAAKPRPMEVALKEAEKRDKKR